MNKQHAAYYLKTLHRILRIPIVYGGGTADSVVYYQPFSLTTGENELDYIFERLRRTFTKFPNAHALFYTHPSSIMLGIVLRSDSDEFVIVGPIAPPTASEKQILEYLEDACVSQSAKQKMGSYMNVVKPLSADNLQELLVNINVVLNEEILSVKELTVIYDEETENRFQYTQKAFMQEATDQLQRETEMVDRFTEKLNYCVKNGDLDGLSDLLNNLAEIPFQETTKADNLNKFKITAYGSVFAAERQALESGLSAAELDETKQYYLVRIDASTDLEEIRKLTISALYDFTKHVKEYIPNQTKNPTVNRVINYIKANIHNKLLAEEIAKSLRINLHYLFVKFKAETGKTLTQYINEEKIKKACYYLLFTDKPLIEIAVTLSFSSQSYFQTVFKKVMGQTPADWRKVHLYTK